MHGFPRAEIDWYNDGLVQDCGISSANALEISQSCTKASNVLISMSLAFTGCYQQTANHSETKVSEQTKH